MFAPKRPCFALVCLSLVLWQGASQDLKTWEGLIKNIGANWTTDKGSACQFPFVYDNKVYSHCGKFASIKKCCVNQTLSWDNDCTVLETCKEKEGSAILPAFVTVVNTTDMGDKGNSIRGEFFRTNITHMGVPLYQKISFDTVVQFLVCDEKQWKVFQRSTDAPNIIANSKVDDVKCSVGGIPPGLTLVSAFDPKYEFQIRPYLKMLSASRSAWGEVKKYSKSYCNSTICTPDHSSSCALGCENSCSERGEYSQGQCKCKDDFFKGKSCENYCSSATCKGKDSQCTDMGTCACGRGNTGVFCDFTCNASSATGTGCHGHGACNPKKLREDERLCECDDPWQGNNCQCNSQITCNGHGQCVPDTGKCNCDTDWFGKDCKTFCNPIETCNDKGICDDGQCKCTDKDYKGDSCQYYCNPECEKGGICAEYPAGKGKGIIRLKCKCKCNFYGDLCEIYDQGCNQSNYCKNGGCCVGTRQCKCNEGYFGLQCDITKSNCDTEKCYGRGRCNYDEKGKLNDKCTCDEGFSGNNCELCTGTGKNCSCNEGCNGNGKCADDGSCDCQCNYGGVTCEVYYEKCVDDEFCRNGGCCERAPEKEAYTCKCKAGFYGDQCMYSEEKRAECDEGQCSGKGVCSFHKSGITCLCDPKFSGEQCGKCGESNNVHGKVVDRRCECDEGYFGQNCDWSVPKYICIAAVLLISVVSICLCCRYYTTVYRVQSAPSGYDDFAILTIKHRSCLQKVWDFSTECTGYYYQYLYRACSCILCFEKEVVRTRNREFKKTGGRVSGESEYMMLGDGLHSDSFELPRHGDSFKFGEEVTENYQK